MEHQDSVPTLLSKDEQKALFKEAIKELFLEEYREFGGVTLTFLLRAAVLGAFAGAGYLFLLSQGWHK